MANAALDVYSHAAPRTVEVLVDSHEVVGHLLSIVTGQCRWLRTPVVRNASVRFARTAGLRRGMRLTQIDGSAVPNINLTEEWLREHVAQHTVDSRVSVVFAFPDAKGPSWLDSLVALGGSFALTAALFPLSLTVNIGGTLLLSFTTYLLMIVAWIMIIWRCKWLGLRRKALGTLILSVCFSFLPMLEACIVAFGIACSTVVIPYSVAFKVAVLSEDRVWKSLLDATLSHLWVMISSPFVVLFMRGGCLALLPLFWNTSQSEVRGETHDIPGVWDMLCGLIFACWGSTVVSFWCTAIVIVKMPFIFLQILYRYCKLFFSMQEECPNNASGAIVIATWVFGAIMLPVQLVIGAAFAVSFSAAAAAAVPAYFAAGWLWFVDQPPWSENSLTSSIRPLRDGLHGCYLVLWCVQACTNMLMWWLTPSLEHIQGRSFSQVLRAVDMKRLTCWPKPRLISLMLRDGWSPVFYEGQVRIVLSQEWLDMLQRSWDSFFSQCQTVGVEALRVGHLSVDLLESCDPTVFVGIPGVVVLRAIQQSPLGKPILQLADGFSVTARQIPKLRDAQEIWQRLMVAKEALETASPSSSEFKLLEVSVLMGNGDPTSFPRAAQAAESALKALDPARLKALMLAQARILGITLQLSQTPRFRHMFEATLDHLSAKAKHITQGRHLKSD